MGVLNDAGNLINRGMASAGRTARSISLKAQISDMGKHRERLESRLGASLYEETRHDSRFRASRESLYSSIESLDIQREFLKVELANIELQVQLATTATSEFREPQKVFLCQHCGRQIQVEDAFCPGCGNSTSLVKESANLCPACGYPLEFDDMFCPNCGIAAQNPSVSSFVLENLEGVESRDKKENIEEVVNENDIPASAPDPNFENEEIPGEDKTTNQATYLCPNCFALIDEAAVFCPHCGASIIGISKKEDSQE